MCDRLLQIQIELEGLYPRRKQQIGNCVEQSLEEVTEQAAIRDRIDCLEREQAELIRSADDV
jgi:hypothetical protein